MKTMADLTPEILAKIPSYIERATEGVFDGGRYERFEYDKAKAAVDWNYKQCGFEPPKVIVAENPVEQIIMYNFLMIQEAESKVFDKNLKEISSQILSKTGELSKGLANETYNALWEYLDHPLWETLGTQFNHALRTYSHHESMPEAAGKIEEALQKFNAELHTTLQDFERKSDTPTSGGAGWLTPLWEALVLELGQSLGIDEQLGDQIREKLNEAGSTFSEPIKTLREFGRQLDKAADRELDGTLDKGALRELLMQLQGELDDLFLHTELASSLREAVKKVPDSDSQKELNEKLHQLLGKGLDELEASFNGEAYNELWVRLLYTGIGQILKLNFKDRIEGSLEDALKDADETVAKLNSQFKSTLEAELARGLDWTLFSALWCEVKVKLEEQLTNSLEDGMADWTESQLEALKNGNNEQSEGFFEKLEERIDGNIEKNLKEELQDQLQPALWSNLFREITVKFWALILDTIDLPLRQEQEKHLSEMGDKMEETLKEQIEQPLKEELRDQLDGALDWRLWRLLSVVMDTVYGNVAIPQQAETMKQLDEIEQSSGKLKNKLTAWASKIPQTAHSELSSAAPLDLMRNVTHILWKQLSLQLNGHFAKAIETQLKKAIKGLSSDVMDKFDQGSALADERFTLHNKILNTLWEELHRHLNKEVKELLQDKLEHPMLDEVHSNFKDFMSGVSAWLVNNLDLNLDEEFTRKLKSGIDSPFKDALLNLYHGIEHSLARRTWSQLQWKLIDDIWNKTRIPQQDYIKALTKYRHQYLLTLDVYSDAVYHWYAFIRDEFNLPLSINDMFEEAFKLQRESGVYSALYSEKFCVVCKYPKMVHRNANNDLHNPNGVAVEWGNSLGLEFKNYFINGRAVHTEYAEKAIAGKFTLEEFSKLENEDVRGAVASMVRDGHGSEALMEMLGCELVDEKEFNHTSGHKETLRLYRTKEKVMFLRDSRGNQGDYMAFLEEKCPSTGTKYLLDTKPEFTCVEEAAKFHRPYFVPKDLAYDFKEFNN